jgi:hypothetical protein
MADPSPATPASGAPLAGAAPDEPAAWAEVEARWGEAAAHHAYLARFPDLDGLATAGRRYRAVLAARPGDAMALAMKAEVLKRATVVGLAMLPRSAPPAAATGRWKRISLLLLAAWLGSTLAFLLWKLLAA